ncbi:MAG: hypothetical protein PHE93_03050 [Clostridia bacterium]|nr:hypothetical protein [Clostridia bacterium]
MKYSAVERVEATVLENDYVSRDIKKRKQFFRPFFNRVDLLDMAIIFVSLGIAVSLGFVVAGLVKALSGVETVVNAISALV